MNASYAPDNVRYEEKMTPPSEDNATFEWTLDIPKDYPRITQMAVGSSWNDESLAGGEHTVHIGRGLHENDWSTRLTVTQYKASEHDLRTEVGYYEPANQSVFFHLENASYEEVTLWMNDDWHGSVGSKFS